MYLISKYIELDVGHRVPFHDSKCRNLHGHRYRVTAAVGATETISASSRRPDAGMVIDFGVIKEVLMDLVHDPYDHRTLIWEEDEYFAYLRDLPGVVPCPVIPTAEELASWWGEKVRAAIERRDPRLTLRAFQVRETPSSLASWTPHL